MYVFKYSGLYRINLLSESYDYYIMLSKHSHRTNKKYKRNLSFKIILNNYNSGKIFNADRITRRDKKKNKKNPMELQIRNS